MTKTKSAGVKAIMMAWVLLTAPMAFGQAYRCIENGKSVFTDRPCAPAKVKKTEPLNDEKTAKQLQEEFEAEQAKIKEGERLTAEAEANRIKKQKMLEEARQACEAEKRKPALVKNSSFDGSVPEVKQYLKNTLRDPSSFEAIRWGEVMRTCDGYMVHLTYRAKNGFGGMTVSSGVFTLDKSGNVVSVAR